LVQSNTPFLMTAALTLIIDLKALIVGITAFLRHFTHFRIGMFPAGRPMELVWKEFV
jgi:hypothetical protein